MTKPVLERIADEVLARVKNITKANEYAFDVNRAAFVDRDTDKMNPRPRDIYIDRGESADNDELSYPGNPPAQAFDVQFEIRGYAKALDTSSTQSGVVDDWVTDNAMIAAICKAITNDSPADWHTFGDNAFNARIVTTGPFDAPGFDGGMVLLEVQYRVSETDPFESR